jgi:hypothetical protein
MHYIKTHAEGDGAQASETTTMRRFFTRESFIPKGAVKISDKQSDAVAYLFTAAGKLYAKVFVGKQAKPIGYYSFRNEAARERYVVEAFTARRERQGYQARRQAERKAFKNPHQVGDILSTCWGYDQTNREFYQVVEVSGLMVTVREIAQERIETGFDQGRAVPVLDKFIGEPLRRRATEGGLKISSCQRATPASFTLVAGVKVYDSVSWSSYA